MLKKTLFQPLGLAASRSAHDKKEEPAEFSVGSFLKALRSSRTAQASEAPAELLL